MISPSPSPQSQRYAIRRLLFPHDGRLHWAGESIDFYLYLSEMDKDRKYSKVGFAMRNHLTS
uniref:Uncharacterized protein n=1 Tax=Cucumis melo TaxID=3656 RepID=A0A9I9EEJ2_CUCME